MLSQVKKLNAQKIATNKKRFFLQESIFYTLSLYQKGL